MINYVMLEACASMPGGVLSMDVTSHIDVDLGSGYTMN